MSTIAIMNIAKEEAKKSTIRCCHGAVITQGKRVIAKGFNHNRTRFRFYKNICSCHAERDVVMKLLSLKGWRKTPWCILWG